MIRGAVLGLFCLAVSGCVSYPFAPCTPTWFRSCGGVREVRTSGPMELPQVLAVRPARAGTFRIYLHTSRFTYWLNEDGLNVYVERAPVGKLIIQARVTNGNETTIQGFSPWDVKQEGVVRAIVKPYPGQTFVDGTYPAFLFEGVIQ